MAKIDNEKMWESILNQLPIHREVSRVHILEALKEQGLQYNSDTKKIEYIKQESCKLEVGKFYRCTKDCYTTVGAKILSKNKVYRCTAENEVLSDFGHSTYVGDLLYYLCPATKEEMKQYALENPLLGDWDFPDMDYTAKEEEIPHSESEQEEMSEFENRLGEIIIPTWDITKECEECKGDVDYIKKFAKELMELARKQLQPEIDAEIDKAYKNQDEVVYKRGYLEGLEAQRDNLTEEILSRVDVDEMVENLSDFRFGTDTTIIDIYKSAIIDTIKAIKGE